MLGPNGCAADSRCCLRRSADARWSMARTNQAGSIDRSATRRGWADDRTCIRFLNMWPVNANTWIDARCRRGKLRTGALAVAPLQVFMPSDRHTDRVAHDSSGRRGGRRAVRPEIAGSPGPDFGFQLLGFVSPDSRRGWLNGDARVDPIRVLVFRLGLSSAARGVLAGRRPRRAEPLPADKDRYSPNRFSSSIAQPSVCDASGSAAGCGRASRPRNRLCSAGTTMSNMIGPTSIPPTITVASGRCT